MMDGASSTMCMWTLLDVPLDLPSLLVLDLLLLFLINLEVSGFFLELIPNDGVFSNDFLATVGGGGGVGSVVDGVDTSIT